LEEWGRRRWRRVGALEKERLKQSCRTGERVDGGCFLEKRGWRIK
jgi:hypothetical protein